MFKFIWYKDKNYFILFILGFYESVECIFLFEEYLVIWEWDVIIKVIINKGIYIKFVIIELWIEYWELEL